MVFFTIDKVTLPYKVNLIILLILNIKNYLLIKSFGFSPSENVNLTTTADTYDCTTIPVKSNEDVDQKEQWVCTDNNRLSWTLIGAGGKKFFKIINI